MFFRGYMQAVVDEIIFGNVDPLKHPSKWNLGKLLKEFNGISGKILNDSFVAITEEALLESLTQLHELSSVSINDFNLPNLPSPPNAFRGIRRKSSALKRWLAICSDDSAKDGKHRPTINLLRKYLGDFIIASYLDVVQESGYDDGYMKEIEGSKPWRYTGKEKNMDRKDIKMLVKSWWDIYNDESLDYKRTNISPIEGEADKVIVPMVSEANAGHYTSVPLAA